MVFGKYRRAHSDSRIPDRLVGCCQQTKFSDVVGLVSLRDDPPRQGDGKLRIDEEFHAAMTAVPATWTAA